MRLLVWTLYCASFCGLLVAGVLANERVKRLMVATWVTVRLRNERVSPRRASRLQRAYLQFYYLDPTGAISLKKTIAWSSLAAAASGTALTATTIVAPTGPTVENALSALAAVFLGLPWHFLVEFLFASTARYVLAKGFNPIKSFLLLLCAFIGLVFVALVYASGLFIAMYVYVDKDAAHILSWSGPGYLYFWLRSGLIFDSKEGLTYALVLASLGASGVLLLGLFTAATIANSRRAHGAIAWLSSKLLLVTPAQMFAGSMALFTLSTGIMQAYSF